MTQAAQLAQYGANNVGLSFKNRIINGDMGIDQRNNGASGVTIDSYPVDRFRYQASQTSKLTWGQNLGSVTPPAGFNNYIGFSSSSAYSITSSDYFVLTQIIEGNNCADLGFGTANAQPVTLSFWVRSSLTGTFSGSLMNDNQLRSYVFTYTVNSANTWEQKTITVPGDTTGTWLRNNGAGLLVRFSLGVGSTWSTTPGSWVNGSFWSATGSTSVVGTNGATWQVTGVQLEKGTVATSFDYLPYSTELQLCQRYCYVSIGANSLVAGAAQASDNVYMKYVLPVPMRATPTISFTASVGQPLTISDQYINDWGASSPSVTQAPTNGEISNRVRISGFSGLTTGRWYGGSPNTTGSMTYSAEL